ncbi:MAG: agmatinase [Candidatus Margulisbacteria bacterium]|nr:agmatinase [Candidatus Margulisiibacteriota bacterium]
MKQSKYSNSRFVVIPCPHEATTSYGKGTKNGPAAILKAWQYLESFDEELKMETDKKAGICMEKPVTKKALCAKTLKVIKDKKTPVILGGEHSLSVEAVKAARARNPRLSVLQLDAHADLRDSYKGNKDFHGSVMRRILEVCPAVQAGLRSLSQEEYDFARKSGQLEKMHFADHVDVVEKIVSQLSDQVYITIDVDVFDPAVMLSTGTPEPGGLFWYEVLDILREVCKLKTVVGVDLVELCPIKGLTAPDFTIAKLAYRVMGYLASK